MFFLSAIAGMVLLILPTMPALADNEKCPDWPLGVNVIQEKPYKIYISVAKAIAFSSDKDSFLLAESEARLQSKYNLIQSLSPGIEKMTLSGIANISVCRVNNEVYATLKFDEENVKRANQMRNLMKKSLQTEPTLKP